MPMSTITSKGQITLPKVIRDRLGVRPGDRVVFRERADGEIVVEAATVDLRTLRGRLRPTRTGVTVEDMKRAARDGGTRR
jgi:AbrB family looped-hinge helix DNA binding protein